MKTRLTSLADITREFGLSQPAARKLLGVLPYMSTGGKYYFWRKDVERFMCRLFRGEVDAFPRRAVTTWKRHAERNGFRCPEEALKEAGRKKGARRRSIITVADVVEEYGFGVVRAYKILRSLPHWREGKGNKLFAHRSDLEALLKRAFQERTDLASVLRGNERERGPLPRRVAGESLARGEF